MQRRCLSWALHCTAGGPTTVRTTIMHTLQSLTLCRFLSHCLSYLPHATMLHTFSRVCGKIRYVSAYSVEMFSRPLPQRQSESREPRLAEREVENVKVHRSYHPCTL